MFHRLIAFVVFCCSLLLPASAGASPGHVGAPAHNWIERLPGPLRARWECILWRESRSTLFALNLGDNNRWGSSGIFQMEEGTFFAYQRRAGVPYSVRVWQASVAQQFAVAHQIFLADGFSPWSQSDGC